MWHNAHRSPTNVRCVTERQARLRRAHTVGSETGRRAGVVERDGVAELRALRRTRAVTRSKSGLRISNGLSLHVYWSVRPIDPWAADLSLCCECLGRRSMSRGALPNAARPYKPGRAA